MRTREETEEKALGHARVIPSNNAEENDAMLQFASRHFTGNPVLVKCTAIDGVLATRGVLNDCKI